MSKYYTELPAVIDGDIAYAKDVNDINTAVGAGFTQVEADVDGFADTVEFYADKAEAWASEDEDVEVAPGKYSSLHYSEKANDSATSASGSAISASGSASAAATSASNASISASSASTSASNAASSASSASTSASNASASASTASTQAGIATTKASEAAASASSALTSYNNTVAIYGSTAAVAAAVSSASTSASNAASSASSASTSASNAASSASSAASSASAASTSASNASTSATNAQNSATSALSSQNAASASASAASTSASNASTSASNAASSASSASTSASNALSSANAAASSASDAETSATEANAATALLQKKIAILQTAVLEGLLPSVDAILATTADLVDVFVYNTYDDYDGGAWTEQAHTQSWYTEALNTATRGSKREFPKVALIVAETNKVTLYDATETGCPMWMVFNGDTTIRYALWGSSLYPISSCFMVSGVLVVGASGSEGALTLIDFIRDVTAVRTNDTARYFSRNVLNRNITQTSSDAGFYSSGLVNRAVNDVAMTTISRTENAYGLLDPVIACLVGESMVRLSDGTDRPIIDIKVGDTVHTSNGPREVLNWWDNGIRDVYELILEDGRSLTCTEDHKVLTARGYVLAKDLTEQDDIVCL